MRTVVKIKENAPINPFYLDELISYLQIETKEFNWFFRDIDIHTLENGEEVFLDIFENGQCFILGEDLEKLIRKYDIMFISGIVTLLDKVVNTVSIKELPIIQQSSDYWEEHYVSPIPDSKLEIGFHDTTNIIFTIPNEVQEYKLNLSKEKLHSLGEII